MVEGDECSGGSMEMCIGRKGSGRKEQEEDDKERKEGGEDARPVRAQATDGGTLGRGRSGSRAERPRSPLWQHIRRRKHSVMETDAPSHAFEHN